MMRSIMRLFLTICLLVGICIKPMLAADKEASDKLTGEAHKARETREWRGIFGGPRESSVFVAKSLEDWDRLWARVSKEPPVSFDPTRDMVIGIFLGTRRTGGYSVEIISASDDGGVFLVEYIERKPGPDKFVIQALTTPYLIKLFPKTDLDVVLKLVDRDQLIFRLREEQEERQAIEHRLKETQLQLQRSNGHIRELEQRIRDLQRKLDRIRSILPPGGIVLP